MSVFAAAALLVSLLTGCAQIIGLKGLAGSNHKMTYKVTGVGAFGSGVTVKLQSDDFGTMATFTNVGLPFERSYTFPFEAAHQNWLLQTRVSANAQGTLVESGGPGVYPSGWLSLEILLDGKHLTTVTVNNDFPSSGTIECDSELFL